MEQVTSVPTFAQTGHQSSFSLQVTSVAGLGVLPDTDFVQIETWIPGDKYREIHGQLVTFKLNINFSDVLAGAGGYYVYLQNSARDRSLIHRMAAPATVMDQNVRFTVQLDTVGNYLLGKDEIGLRIGISLARPSDSGTFFTLTEDTFISGDKRVGAGQSNTFNVVGSHFRMAQTALYIGDVDPLFDTEFPSEIDEQLGRFYEINNYNSGIDEATGLIGRALTIGTAAFQIPYTYEKAAVPTKINFSAAGTFDIEHGPASVNSVTSIDASTLIGKKACRTVFNISGNPFIADQITVLRGDTSVGPAFTEFDARPYI